MKKDAISKFQNESDLKKFLDNLVKFNKYSYNNQMLIWIQKPDAEYVASYRDFQKMGYYPNKDTGIKIFIPYFMKFAKIQIDNEKYEIKPYYLLNDTEKDKLKDKSDESITFYKQKLTGFSLGNVFDAKDTNMPMEEINSELNPILEDNKADEIMDCFIKTIYNDGFKVKFNEEMPSGAKGYCNHKNNEIVVKKGLGSLMQLKVLIHEYAHALAHKHLENNNRDYQEHRNQYETEAESISYSVSKYLGMNTGDYTLTYLYAWSKEKDFKEVDDSLNTIVNYSKKIISNFEKFYNREFGLYADEKNSVNI